MSQSKNFEVKYLRLGWLLILSPFLSCREERDSLGLDLQWSCSEFDTEFGFAVEYYIFDYNVTSLGLCMLPNYKLMLSAIVMQLMSMHNYNCYIKSHPLGFIYASLQRIAIISSLEFVRFSDTC